MTCQYPSDNHSDDTITVYHGTDPLELCGYHAGRGVQAALDAIEAALRPQVDRTLSKVCDTCAKTGRLTWRPCANHETAADPATCSHELTSETLLNDAPNGLSCHACGTQWVRACNRCNSPVSLSSVSDGYSSYCPEHDEDLYTMETYLMATN